MRGARARLQARVVRLREVVCLCRCDGFLRPPGGSTKASDGSAPGPTAQRERAGVSLGPPGSGCEDTEVRSVSLARGPNRRRLVAVAAGCSSWAGFWQLG